MAASPYCLYALAFILIRSASALIGALSAQQAILHSTSKPAKVTVHSKESTQLDFYIFW